MEFVNLYVQTEYSILSSAIKLNSLVENAIEEKAKFLAITDNALYGTIKFYNLCIKNNIKPIIGLALEMQGITKTSSTVLLYAKSIKGYQNLMLISSKQKMQERITLDDIKGISDEIVAILASDENEVIKLIKSSNYSKAQIALSFYLEVFNDLYFGIDLQTNEARSNISNIIEFAHNNKVLPVAINKSNYFDGDFPLYQIIRSIALNINNYSYTEKETNEALLSSVEAKLLFKDYEELILNTFEIANKCNLEIPFGEYKMPKYEHENANLYLLELCKLGLNKRLKGKIVDVNKYKERLLYEIKVITKMGFCDYFLIVYDYVKYAKTHDILVGPGRGSGAGSLVSYVLGITDIDPIEYDLLFERFLNPERVSMPDIDVDFPDDKRDEVIRYIASKYGKTRVANITTFGTYGPKLALRDVARILKIGDTRLNIIMKYIPNVYNISLSKIIEDSEDLKKMISGDEDIKLLFNYALSLEGMPRNLSTHAAGIIMADKDLTFYTPLQNGLNSMSQTQYEAEDLSQLGLVKMDILGLKNLSIIKETSNSIRRWENPNFDIHKIPLNDKEVYKMIARADTDGLFQLESKGMRKLLVDLKTSSFDDIVNANALFRPGPMDMIPTFIARKFGKEYSYLHNDLKDILNKTYGIIVFQEQIMLIAQKFAGYSLGMADNLRRAVSKKKVDEMLKERQRFVDGAMNNGYSEQISNKVYDYIVKFANYGFNKSHAVAYSLIGYQMGYLKIHAYKYFMAVLMSNNIGNMNSLSNYINDCKKKRIVVNPPNINISGEKFVANNDGIYYPLLGIYNVGSVIVNQILEERTKGLFKDYLDFISRCKDFINKRICINLIHAGCFDSFNISRKEAVETYDENLELKSLINVLGDKVLNKKQEYQEYSLEEISRLEKEALGINIKYNLFLQYNEEKKKYRTTNINELKSNEQTNVIFYLKHIKQINTKKQEEMAFLDIMDDTGSIDATVFPTVYKEIKKYLEIDKVYICLVKSEIRNEKAQIIIEKIIKIL